MTLQFVHGGVDRDGAPLHFHIRDGRISGLNGEAAPADGAGCVDLQGFAVLPGLVDGHIHLDKSFVGDRWHPHQPVNSLRERLAVEKAAVAGAAPIAQRAENFMRLNLRRNIYMNEICDAAGVSERGLRYAFEDLFGTSPNRYLSMLRLCAACRSLSMADSSRRSVKAIALSCGLWDLSRFADNYRKVFGELPRDTLMRAPAQIGQPA
nr:helix-turn-helix domain-containing protein [Stenotrophomonas maltophilia]